MHMIDTAEWATASTAIQIHIVLALGAFALGTAVVLIRRGTALHKGLGRGFGLLAVGTALSSFFIHEIRWFGIWSPIHLLSLLMLWLIWKGVKAIRRGDLHTHRIEMMWAYTSGFVVAGAFTFLPGRRMHDLLLARPLDALWPGGSGAALAYALPVVATVVGIGLLRTIYRQKTTIGHRAMTRA